MEQVDTLHTYIGVALKPKRIPIQNIFIFMICLITMFLYQRALFLNSIVDMLGFRLTIVLPHKINYTIFIRGADFAPFFLVKIPWQSDRFGRVRWQIHCCPIERIHLPNRTVYRVLGRSLPPDPPLSFPSPVNRPADPVAESIPGCSRWFPLGWSGVDILEPRPHSHLPHRKKTREDQQTIEIKDIPFSQNKFSSLNSCNDFLHGQDTILFSMTSWWNFSWRMCKPGRNRLHRCDSKILCHDEISHLTNA